MNSKTDKKTGQVPDSKPQGNPADANPDLQGEGNYTASRRFRKSAEAFVDSGKVKAAAKDAAPKTDPQRREMQAAESEGKSHARK